MLQLHWFCCAWGPLLQNDSKAKGQLIKKKERNKRQNGPCQLIFYRHNTLTRSDALNKGQIEAL